MKKVFVLFLAGLIMVQALSKIVVVANYHLDKAYIAAVLCENRQEPEMACHGKCYLQKQLKATDKAEKQAPNQVKEKFDLLFCHTVVKAHLARPMYFPVAYPKVNPPIYFYAANAAIFHPPQFTC